MVKQTSQFRSYSFLLPGSGSWVLIFASGPWELPWSLSSSLQGSMAWVGRLTSVWVTCEAGSLGDATGSGLGSLGPSQSLSPSKGAEWP